MGPPQDSTNLEYTFSVSLLVVLRIQSLSSLPYEIWSHKSNSRRTERRLTFNLWVSNVLSVNYSKSLELFYTWITNQQYEVSYTKLLDDCKLIVCYWSWHLTLDYVSISVNHYSRERKFKISLHRCNIRFTVKNRSLGDI